MTNIIWFRHGLRLHDNPALLSALANIDQNISLLPIFIFDGESAGTKCVGYNRMRFLLDSLQDLNSRLQEASDGRGQLYIFKGQPTYIFRKLNEVLPIRKICVEQDCEPIWNQRDSAIQQMCRDLGIQYIEKVSHTLWDPRLVIDTNGGIPPLTYQMFLHTVQIIGLPPRPEQDANFSGVRFAEFSTELKRELHVLENHLTPEYFHIYSDNMGYIAKTNWIGGETQALLLLEERLKVEQHAFERGFYLPNQAIPNILDTPKSMSAHLRFGCLSVRHFYWSVHDLFKNVQLRACVRGVQMNSGAHITGQLIWREYFYTMSIQNPNYDRMEGNEICLNIPWAPPNSEDLQRWRLGQTGFPLIDGAMRQLLAEGWLHHTLRNTVATFLTRGGLWQNWEHGLQHFLKYLLDADWSVCAGNWMWVSSSAFERLLDSSLVTCPVALAKRLDPNGTFVKQYVPELRNVPNEFVHEPWRMSQEQQECCECLIGVHYPERIIDLSVAAKRNMLAMKTLRSKLIADGLPPPHCRPSNDEEIRQFFWLAD